jgi:hypothetical protein
MSYRFEDIAEKNVDDLMSVCGNMPGIDKDPHFVEGRAARRRWLLGMIERFGTVGVLAYGDDGMAKGFVECLPATAHPLGKFSADPEQTVAIDCAWYRKEVGLPVRKTILDYMFATHWFDKPIGKKCRFVDVLALKGAPLMQYDFYHEYGFKDAIELTGQTTSRYVLRYPVEGDDVTPRKEVIEYSDGGRNVLVLGAYDQCYMPFMVNAKVRNALKGVKGLSVKEVDYWAGGEPMLCEASINGKPAFDQFVFFMDDEQIRESVRRKMI